MSRAAVVVLALMLWASPFTARAEEFARCLEPGYLAAFDDRLSPQVCDEITTAEIRWRGGTALLRAVRPHAMAMLDSAALIDRIHELAIEVEAAMDRMEGSLRLDDVTLVFTNELSPADEFFPAGGYTAAARPLLAHECPVIYYMGASRSVGDDFSFVLAHEIFHCIQYRTWPSMPSEQVWLIEGGAEYFAFLARPTYRGGRIGHIANFDLEIPGRPMPDMSYSAAVFFLWLGDAYGPPRAREFIASARSIEGSVAPDMWIEFAQAYFDQRIHLPDGAALPSTPQMGGTRAIHGDDHLDMPPVAPYTLNNAVFAFDRDKLYELVHAPSPPDVRIRWRKVDGEAWEPPLTRVSTCHGAQSYRVIWTSTESTAVGDSDVRAQPAASGECTCPVGVWQETESSLRRMMEQSALGGTQTTFISGRRILRLNPDHTGSFAYEAVITETRSSWDSWTRQTKIGVSNFTWTIVNGTLMTTLTPGDNLLTLHNERHTPSGVRVEERRAGVQSIGHAFSCDDAGLHLRHSAPPGALPVTAPISVDMDFTRVAGAPAPSP